MSLTYPTKVKEFVIDCWFMQGLVEIKKSTIYLLIDRLIWLILTLLVSTATTERVFSIMKIVKIRLHNQMDEFFCRLFDCYIKKKNWYKIHNGYDNQWFLFQERSMSIIKINM